MHKDKLEYLQKNVKGWTVLDSGEYKHTGFLEYDYTHFESAFVAGEIRKHPRESLLDIGSYYHFVLGLSGSFNSVISIDCRSYGGSRPENLEHLVCDASNLPFPDNTFSTITSQCTLEHIGLGCYGDSFNWDGDRLAISEMKRVLKPDGFLILTSTIANTNLPVVFYNCHRIYNFKAIKQYFKDFKLCHEEFYSVLEKKIIPKKEITKIEGGFDVFGGCWQNLK
ncbi:MAG: class I SAM-dependent methyltransferase [Promethearchaeota archaeon]|jgi:SAM-dependent methyltransferase